MRVKGVCGGRSPLNPKPSSYSSFTLVCAALFLASARPAGCDDELQIFRWPGTQQAGMGCLLHDHCEAGLFCKEEIPPEKECKTARGWKVVQLPRVNTPLARHDSRMPSAHTLPCLDVFIPCFPFSTFSLRQRVLVQIQLFCIVYVGYVL